MELGLSNSVSMCGRGGGGGTDKNGSREIVKWVGGEGRGGFSFLARGGQQKKYEE